MNLDQPEKMRPSGALEDQLIGLALADTERRASTGEEAHREFRLVRFSSQTPSRKSP